MLPKPWQLLIILILLAYAPASAFGGQYLNTFEPVANLSANGETLEATVLLGCDQGEKFQLRVTVTQRGTGAVAEGWATGVCRGKEGSNADQQAIAVTAHLIGNSDFDSSKGATPAGLVTTFNKLQGDRTPTDVHQWIPDFDLSLQ